MEKLTAQQIIEILKEIYLDGVSSFAYEKQPHDFENYPEVLEAQKVRKEFTNKHLINYEWDSEENKKIYYNLPNEYEIIKELSRKKYGLNWTEVEQYGGEDKGSTWYSVKYFPDHDVYLRVDGYYESYNGIEFYDGWNCVKEVKPQQKTIVVYE